MIQPCKHCKVKNVLHEVQDTQVDVLHGTIVYSISSYCADMLMQRRHQVSSATSTSLHSADMFWTSQTPGRPKQVHHSGLVTPLVNLSWLTSAALLRQTKH